MLQFIGLWCILLFFLSMLHSGYTYTIDNETETIQYLSGVLTEGLANASLYELPTSADIHRPEDNEERDYGTYDFIIVGGGVTGSVIASRLSEMENFKILLLEAGKLGNEFIKFPTSVFTSVRSEYNWGFRSIPQTTACLGYLEQRCTAAQGKGLGGGSLINGIIYQRGDPRAFNKWADTLKDSSWSYENVLPLFKKSENFEYTNRWAPVDESYHGTGGNLKVDHVLPPDELTGIFLDANKRLGYTVADYNGPNMDVASVFQLYKNHGPRHDIFTAFLKPVLHRSNLKVLTESYVTKIEIDNVTKVVTGVFFTRSGKTYRAKANKEVILSAGVFMSPKLLMLSGVGPRKHLEEMDIAVVEDLEVGSQLIDDVATQSFLFASSLYLPNQTQEETVKDYLHGTGTLTVTFPSQGVAWYKSKVNDDSDFTDFELTCLPTSRSALATKIADWKNETYYLTWGNTTDALQMDIINVNPLSRGSVRLSSKDPFEFPLIDFNLLSDPEGRDIAVMYEGIKLSLELFETPSFQKLKPSYAGSPLPECQQHEFLSKDYWYCFLRQTSLPAYHSKGSCKMGTNREKGDVVDSTFRVFGIDRLRVADASIFPTAIGGHPSAACIMFGEKLSEIIKNQYDDDP